MTARRPPRFVLLALGHRNGVPLYLSAHGWGPTEARRTVKLSSDLADALPFSSVAAGLAAVDDLNIAFGMRPCVMTDGLVSAIVDECSAPSPLDPDPSDL